MKPTNNISNTQEQVFQSWMASCLAMTHLGFVCMCFAMVLLRSFRASLRAKRSNPERKAGESIETLVEIIRERRLKKKES